MASNAALPYTPDEMMATVAARELADGEVVFVGIGLPNLACNLARATHAPRRGIAVEREQFGRERTLAHVVAALARARRQRPPHQRRRADDESAFAQGSEAHQERRRD